MNRIRSAAAALLATTLLTACGGPLAASSGTDIELGSQTAVLTGREIRPVGPDPEQRLPARVTSDDRSGSREVTVTSTERVLALDMSGSLAATVWGLGFGDTLIGRDTSTTFPGTEDLPLVTVDGHAINAEAVLGLRPTLVITDGAIGPRDVVEQLRDAGITVVFIDRDPSFDGAVALAHRVAEVFGAPAAGQQLARRITADIAAAHRDVTALVPDGSERLSMVFLYLRGGAGVYYLFGRESGASDLITGLGGVDIAAELGWAGMRPMTDEAIAAADPDLILVMTDGLASVGGVDGLLSRKPAIALTAAGKNRRFVDMADGEVLSFGPRAGDVLRALGMAIYGDRAGP